MAEADTPIPPNGYSSSVRKVLIVGKDGNPVLSGANEYEYKALSIGDDEGAGVTDFDVTIDGDMFENVTTAQYIQVRNNDGSNIIGVKLNSTTNGAISVAANGGELVIDRQIPITNLFITTTTGHSGTTEILLIGR